MKINNNSWRYSLSYKILFSMMAELLLGHQNGTHTALDTRPHVAHSENHFCALSLGKWMAVFLRLSMKMNFCAGIFQQHFHFFTPSRAQKKAAGETRGQHCCTADFSMLKMGEMKRESERSFHRWWQRDDGMSKMLGDVAVHTNTLKRIFFLRHEKLQKLKYLTSAIAQKSAISIRILF